MNMKKSKLPTLAIQFEIVEYIQACNLGGVINEHLESIEDYKVKPKKSDEIQ